MSRLSSLLRQVEALDSQLAADLKRETDALSGRRAFGLNFERHIPEDGRAAEPVCADGGQGPVPSRAGQDTEWRRPQACGGLAGFAGPTRAK